MSFDKNLALKLVRLSEKSYSCLTVKIENDGFLLETEKDAHYLIFPGSYETKDWISDFETVKVERDGLGQVHNGFADVFDVLKKDIMKRLDPKKKLYIAGHSQGGAVATITSLSLHNNGYNIEGVYAFGSPRVGGWSWKKNFTNSKIKLFRVISGKDIVTSVPKFLYFHVGEEININKRGFFSWFHDRFFDHKIENYIAGILKL